MDSIFVRPSTPNMAMYDDEDDGGGKNPPPKLINTVLGSSETTSRPGTGKIPPDAVIYKPPISNDDISLEASLVGGAGMGVWTIEGDQAKNLDLDQDSNSMFDEDDTKILLDKEFDDPYEDRVHKSAGPVVFVSKTLGMLPVIWTEDEAESECKSYFNLYTFVIFIGKYC